MNLEEKLKEYQSTKKKFNEVRSELRKERKELSKYLAENFIFVDYEIKEFSCRICSMFDRTPHTETVVYPALKVPNGFVKKNEILYHRGDDFTIGDIIHTYELKDETNSLTIYIEECSEQHGIKPKKTMYIKYKVKVEETTFSYSVIYEGESREIL